MIFNSMTINNSILETAMQASALRNDVITNNIANAETPGFKKKVVLFEDSLQRALDRAPSKRKVDLSRVRSQVTREHSRFKYRLDENNVDIDREMMSIYQNNVKYDTLSTSVMNNYRRINLVLNAK